MKKFMAHLKDLFFTREFIRYFISGFVATIVDLGVFTLLSRQLGLGQWYWSNLPAVIASVVSAYVMNRIWVFRSTDHLLKEFMRFAGTRIAISAFFTYLFYPLLYYGLHIQYEVFKGLPLARLLALLFVILGNRVTGKLYVFRHEHCHPDDVAEKISCALTGREESVDKLASDMDDAASFYGVPERDDRRVDFEKLQLEVEEIERESRKNDQSKQDIHRAVSEGNSSSVTIRTDDKMN